MSRNTSPVPKSWSMEASPSGSKESTLKGCGLHLPPKRGLPIENIGFLITNAKAQMSNECQRPKSKNVIGLTLKTGIPRVCTRLNGQRDLSAESPNWTGFLQRDRPSCWKRLSAADGRRSPDRWSGFFTESFRHLIIWIWFVIWILTFVILIPNLELLRRSHWSLTTSRGRGFLSLN